MSIFSKISSFISSKAREIGAARAASTFDQSLNDVKTDLLNSVKNHTICKELQSLTSPSKYIPGSPGTTLFGFLGFYSGTDPVSDLIEYLDQNIKLESTRKYKIIGRKVITNIILPSKEDMNSDMSLRLPWIDVAWPVIVEDGTIAHGGSGAGAKFFLDTTKSENSRSNLGIQVRGKVRPEILGIPFLSEIFSEYRAQFK